MRLLKKVLLLAAAALPCAICHALTAYDDQAPMIKIGSLLLDPATTPEEQEFVAKSLAEARANIVAIYGEQKAEMPDVIWCKTKVCATYFSGPDGRSFASPGMGHRREGAQYVFRNPSIVITRQARVRDIANLRAVETLTHELSHAEFRARLRKTNVPAWFNEGIATYVGKEQSCRAAMRGIDRLADLETGKQWTDYTNRDNKTLINTYCQASGEVGDWIDAHGGFKAIVELLGKRSTGTSFESLYGSSPKGDVK